MNTAVRAAVRLGIDKGHVMLGVCNGIKGLIAGDIAMATRLLTRAYAIEGVVERGDGRGGSELDCPTANIRLGDYQRPAYGIYSVRATKLFTIVADTMGGGHDTIGGCCSAASNMFRYKVPDTPSCYANFLRALARHGMGEKDIVANINFFMNVPVLADGTMGIVDGKSKPGDSVELRAETRVLAVVSNCPQVHNPCNGFNPTPIRVVVTDTAG